MERELEKYSTEYLLKELYERRDQDERVGLIVSSVGAVIEAYGAIDDFKTMGLPIETFGIPLVEFEINLKGHKPEADNQRCQLALVVEVDKEKFHSTEGMSIIGRGEQS